ncbi:MAG: FdhF/YdeP family oxidoreductase [Candidatus Nanopelagicales bacterium]|nr:FdhF/YdeP family oxidoreductase [Candidatus Nanopelagicales bacterium]
MAQPRVNAAGGLPAIGYVMRKAWGTGEFAATLRRLKSKNTCKTCAVGMGGQSGGMVNEAGHFPEVCKKSVQAQAADMQPGIEESVFARYDLDALRRMTSAEVENLGRLAFPIVLRPGTRHFERISWEQALALAGDALRVADPGRTFWYASGRSGNESAFLMQLVARAYGTSNIHNCSFYCHNASSVALADIYGSATASTTLGDLAKADVVLLAGANPASNHPRLITQLIHLRRRGGKVIVVNPMSELGLRRFRLPSDVRSLTAGSKVSDLYLQPRIGGDIALFSALLRLVRWDEGFVDASTTGAEAVRAHIDGLDLDDLAATCGVPLDQIRTAADVLSDARRGVFMWSMGLTHHMHGTANIRALGNLALARGFLGKPGAGLMPIRGHSNVQGVGSMGVSPGLKDAFAAELSRRFGIEVPDAPGQDTYASMEAAHAGQIDVAVLVGGNLWGSNPDSAWAAQALQNIDVTVSLTTKLNPGHFHGNGRTSVILPVLARDEEEQATTQESMFNYVRLSSGGTPNITAELRSETDILASLASSAVGDEEFDWGSLRSHSTLRESIAAVVPGYTAIGQIETEGEFQVAGRTFHEPRFATDDGKAHFQVVEVPPVAPGFQLMTIRSEGQFNTVVYDEEDLYRGNSTRDVVMLNAVDAALLGIREGDTVEVASGVGAMTVCAAIVDIARGCLAMYYPEANQLVAARLDAESRTPAFKSVPVTIRKV